VEAPDWVDSYECGNGLHGLLWGDGDWSHLSMAMDATWQVVEVSDVDLRTGQGDLKNKCKFRCGTVIYSGIQAEAVTMVVCSKVNFDRLFACAKAADEEAAAAGGSSKAASSGRSSTAASSGGSSKAASSGDYSMAASSGYSSTAASSGYSSTAASSGGSSKAASSGRSSTAASSGGSSKAASSGYSSMAASSGDYSMAASSGYSSTAASSGDYSMAEQIGKSGIAASIGKNGCAKVGELGLIIVTYWDKEESRYKACVGEVGKDGIKADTYYHVVNGKLVEKEVSNG
jgi:hypothetical protein